MVSEKILKDPEGSTMADLTGISLLEKLQGLIIIVSLFRSNILKLDVENFLVWKGKIIPSLRGDQLDKFVLINEPDFMHD